jgi:hypothetical protein
MSGPAHLVLNRLRAARHAAAKPHNSNRGLGVLDDDTLANVLLEAKAAGTLASLASSSRQTTQLARGRVPVQLCVCSQEDAEMVLGLQASGRPGFSACTQLSITAADDNCCVLVPRLVSAAQQWTALQQLELDVTAISVTLGPGATLDHFSYFLMSTLPGLQQLRSLQLTEMGFGAYSAGLVGQLQQLTSLRLATRRLEADVPADLSALSLLNNLRELQLDPAPAVQPAASRGGPFSLPSSLLQLEVVGTNDAATTACWATHLAACPQLKQLQIKGCDAAHASVHPGVLVESLAQHTPHLTSLHVDFYHREDMYWDVHVAGLPDAAGPVDWEWRPCAALAALTGLEELEGFAMYVKSQADWEVLSQLRGLTRWHGGLLHCAPAAGVTLGVVELEYAEASVSGDDLGRALLACTALQQADKFVDCDSPPTAPQLAGPPLPAHQSLRCLSLSCVCFDMPGPHFAAFAPVLAGVRQLVVSDWSLRSSDHAGSGLVDLTHCTALTELRLHIESAYVQPSTRTPPREWDYVLMLTPVMQLRRLVVSDAPGLSAKAVLVLQHRLPQLQQVVLDGCGRMVRAAAGITEEAKQRAEQLVERMLRPGLQLTVTESF